MRDRPLKAPVGLVASPVPAADASRWLFLLSKQGMLGHQLVRFGFLPFPKMGDWGLTMIHFSCAPLIFSDFLVKIGTLPFFRFQRSKSVLPASLLLSPWSWLGGLNT